MMDPISKRLQRSTGKESHERGRGPVVLMYHGLHAGRAPGPWPWSVPADRFEAQARFLSREGWTSLRVTDLADRGRLPERAVVLTFDDGYRDNYELAYPVLSSLGLKATWFVATRYIGEPAGWEDSSSYRRLLLTGGQLREMAVSGMEIAAHTRTHRDLTQLGPAAQAEEIAGSKSDLEQLLGSEVVSFAYPFGRFNEQSLLAVSHAGYRLACTTQPGWVGSERDPLRIRRVAVFSHDTESSLARKLAFADTNVRWSRMLRYGIGRVRARLGFGR